MVVKPHALGPDRPQSGPGIAPHSWVALLGAHFSSCAVVTEALMCTPGMSGGRADLRHCPQPGHQTSPSFRPGVPSPRRSLGRKESRDLGRGGVLLSAPLEPQQGDRDMRIPSHL